MEFKIGDHVTWDNSLGYTGTIVAISTNNTFAMVDTSDNQRIIKFTNRLRLIKEKPKRKSRWSKQ